MNLRGLGAGPSPRLAVDAGFRSGLLRHLSVAIGGASGVAVVMGAYELLQKQPAAGFALLRGWGPTFLIALLAIWVLGGFLGGMNATVRESFAIVAESVKDSAAAAARQADALTRLADQGGHQTEEVRRLAIYATREFPAIAERFNRTDDALERLTYAVTELHARLDRGTGQTQ